MSVYVASSWKNVFQPAVVSVLRSSGLRVYDFRQPTEADGGLGGSGFSWSEVDPEWKQWTARKYAAGLSHPAARRGFHSDMSALAACSACLLVLPAGRSAHLELGWAAGAGKRLAVYFPMDAIEVPELMLAVAHNFVIGPDELVRWATLEAGRAE